MLGLIQSCYGHTLHWRGGVHFTPMMVWLLIFFLVHSSVLQGDVEVGVNPGCWQVNEDQFSLDVSLHLPLFSLLLFLLLLHVVQVLLMTSLDHI